MTKYQIERGVAIAKDKLHLNPWNPNKMRDREQQALAESISEYGQILELIVRPHPNKPEHYQIIDGAHRFETLGETVFCNVIYGLSDANAKKLTIIMNETRGEADKIELAQLLASIEEDMGDDLITALPYTETELDELIRLAAVDWDQFDQPGSEESTNESQSSTDTDGWVVFTVKASVPAMDVINQAHDLLKDEKGDQFHHDRAIAWGQFLEYISADYLAGPH